MRRDALIVLAAAALGCGTSPAPQLSQLEREVFAKSCVFSACHKGASPAGGLSLEPKSYGRLVGQAAAGVPGRQRVVPGDPGASYLIEKLESATPQAGARMPPTEPLPTETIRQIRRWIEDGAKNE